MSEGRDLTKSHDLDLKQATQSGDVESGIGSLVESTRGAITDINTDGKDDDGDVHMKDASAASASTTESATTTLKPQSHSKSKAPVMNNTESRQRPEAKIAESQSGNSQTTKMGANASQCSSQIEDQTKANSSTRTQSSGASSAGIVSIGTGAAGVKPQTKGDSKPAPGGDQAMRAPSVKIKPLHDDSTSASSASISVPVIGKKGQSQNQPTTATVSRDKVDNLTILETKDTKIPTATSVSNKTSNAVKKSDLKVSDKASIQSVSKGTAIGIATSSSSSNGNSADILSKPQHEKNTPQQPLLPSIPSSSKQEQQIKNSTPSKAANKSTSASASTVTSALPSTSNQTEKEAQIEPKKPLSSSTKKPEEALPPNPLLDPKSSTAKSSTAGAGSKNTGSKGSSGGSSGGQQGGGGGSKSSKSTSKSTPTRAPSSSSRRKPPKTQLEAMYPPFILPTDQSVDDARHRLKTAIEQTRVLREAFTERLYEKYRVVLRPVPKSDHEVINSLTTKPKIMYQQLMQQIGVIQAEKDAEKKIAQQINSQLSAANANNNSAEAAAILGGLTGIDNAEQLGWFGAGLNLVILPEEDINEVELQARGIKERSPIDPETGQKVKDLSSAAAVAASAMLDRVRKGAEMRSHRIRKQEAGGFSGSDGGTAGGFLSTASSSASYLSSPAGVKPYAYSSSSSVRHSSTRGTDSQSSGVGGSSSGKFSKGSKITGSLASLLSISPDAEGMRPNRKLSAAAYALMQSKAKKMEEDCNNSASGTVGGSYQPYHTRHPFPQSKGARSISYGQIQGHSMQHPFSLPTLATANDRRRLIQARSLNNENADTNNDTTRAKSKPHRMTHVDCALKSVVEQFVDGTSQQTGKDSSETNKPPRLRLKRKVSEIRVLHLHREKRLKSSTTATPAATELAPAPNNNKTDGDHGLSPSGKNDKGNANNKVDPQLIMSVMKSLGYIQKSTSSCADDLLSDEYFTIHDALRKRIRAPLPVKSKKAADAVKDDETKSTDAKIGDFPLPSDLTKRTVLGSVLNLDPLTHENNDSMDTNENNGKPEGDKSLTDSVDGICIQRMDTSTDKTAQEQSSSETQTSVEKKSLSGALKDVGSSIALPTTSAAATTTATPTFIPSLRGGGEATDDENAAFEVNSPGSKGSSTRRASDGPQMSSNVQQNNDLATVRALWNDQRNHQQNLGNLQAQESPTAMAQQQAYAMMSAGIRTADPVTSGMYSQGQQQNSSLAAAMNIGPLQTVQHRPNIQHSLNGDQFRQQSFQSVNNHQMHLSPNQLQQAAAALQSGHILRPGSSAEMNDYFNSMHPVSISQAYNHTNPEWTALATQHGLLTSHPSNPIDPSSLGLTPHQAAMLFRDSRTAQVLLAREQQQQIQAAQVAAAQQSAIMSQATFLSANANSSPFVPRPQTSEASGTNSRKSRPNSSSSSRRPISLNSSQSNIAKKDFISPDNSRLPSKNQLISRPSSAPAPQSKVLAKLPGTNEKQKRPTNNKGQKPVKPLPAKKSIISKHQVKKKPTVSVPTAQVKMAPTQTSQTKKVAPMSNRNSKAVNDKHTIKKESNAKTTNHATKSPAVKASAKKPSTSSNSRPLTDPSSTPLPVVKGNNLPEANTAKLPLSNVGNKTTPPSRSCPVTDDKTKFILDGYFHEAVKTNKSKPRDTTNADVNGNQTVDGDEKISKDDKAKKNESLLQFLLKVGATIPIPKTFLLKMLKMRLNTPFFKSSVTTLSTNSGSLMDPSDVIAAVITTWLWANHRETFEAAFAENAQIDLDPNCKWLVRAAIDKATNENVAKGMERLVLNSAIATQNSPESTPTSMKLKVASIVSESLNSGISLNNESNAILPNLDALIDYLDHLRTRALRTRCQERVLLADLISRRTRMSEAFSNAYTSSLIRACEAIGYDEVGEIVQNESTMSSSQMPFDILSDASGAWEDPCRPISGYTTSSAGDELMKRAHARAMIQRSLKKLQDRHNIRGGTPSAGPYSDAINAHGSKGITSPPPPPRPSPRSGSKRKTSSSSGADGIRSMNAAATAALFAPNHHSVPFIWDADDVENNPYGRFAEIKTGRHRSPSTISRSGPFGAKRLKTSTSTTSNDGGNDEAIQSKITCTRALEWSSVAEMFQNVVAVEKPNRSTDHDDHNVAVPLGSTIFAPFCRKIDKNLTLSEEDSEEDADDNSEENLDDEHILNAHQKVLNTIKDKFDTMMRIRQEYQERSRRASFGR